MCCINVSNPPMDYVNTGTDRPVSCGRSGWVGGGGGVEPKANICHDCWEGHGCTATASSATEHQMSQGKSSFCGQQTKVGRGRLGFEYKEARMTFFKIRFSFFSDLGLCRPPIVCRTIK